MYISQYPEIYYKIADGEYEEIKKYFSVNNINEPVEYQWSYEISGRKNNHKGEILPVEIAVDNNNTDVLKYMLNMGAVLPDNILTRVKEPKMIKEVYNLGGNLEYTYGDKSLYNYCLTPEQMTMLYELGLDIKKYGNSALISYAYDLSNQKPFDKNDDLFRRCDFLIKNGADINYQQKSSLNHNLLIDAAYYGNMDLVKYLIENGADVTITDKIGKRAYNWALYNENYDVAEYLKSIEPSYLHNLDKKTAFFKQSFCPESMIEFFMKKDTIVNTGNGYQKFLYITDTYVLDYDNHKFIVLSDKGENYDPMILWSEDLKSICSFDYEHQVLTRHCLWEEFYSDMPRYIQDAVEWKGEHIGDWDGCSDAEGNTPKGDIYWEDL